MKTLAAACDVALNIVPAYYTFQAVVSPSAESTKRWLTFWVIHTAFSSMELVLDIFGAWVPVYLAAKTAFVLYLVFFGGAASIYNGCVRAALERYEGRIDAGLDSLQVATASNALRWARSGLSQLRDGPGWLAPAAAAATLQVEALAASSRGGAAPS